jgi:hypothetical protein
LCGADVRRMAAVISASSKISERSKISARSKESDWIGQGWACGEAHLRSAAAVVVEEVGDLLFVSRNL